MLSVSSSELIQRMPQAGLFLARSCTAGWIGAASLFVVVGVNEVTRGGFDSTTKDALVAIRFPGFYLFGFMLVTLALIGTITARMPQFPGIRRQWAIAMLIVVLCLMFVDYHWIYSPLLKMVTPPGQAKDASFVTYHEASKWINLIGLLFCSVAVCLVNWPHRERTNSPRNPTAQ